MDAGQRDSTAPSLDAWVNATREATGLPTTALGAHALFAVLDALAELLTWDEAETIARELPYELAAVVRSGARRKSTDGSVAELVHAVEWREKVDPGSALEHATAVCRVLAERLSPHARAKLHADLPRSLSLLLEGPPKSGHLERIDHAPRPVPRHTLAEGRPTSSHPISEARPETAHEHSVARNADPHGETKLSSARGLTQERLGDALATAVPRPPRPISQGH